MPRRVVDPKRGDEAGEFLRDGRSRISNLRPAAIVRQPADLEDPHFVQAGIAVTAEVERFLLHGGGANLRAVGRIDIIIAGGRIPVRQIPFDILARLTVESAGPSAK